jgi:glycine cleavage system regulatory protein
MFSSDSIPNHWLFLLNVLTLIFVFRPGMLAAVSDKIASKGMSFEDITTTLRVSRMGQREFVIDALVSSPTLLEKENLDLCIEDLSSLKEDLELSHFDIRVHIA